MDAYCCFAFSCRPTCTSLYLPEPVYEALRKIAFEECLKIHDVPTPIRIRAFVA